MSFNIKIKYDNRLIQKAKVNNIEDFDPIMEGLKEKFGCKKRRFKP